MKEFKSNPLVIGKNIIFAVFGGILVAIIANFFLTSFLSVILGIVIFGAISYLALVSNNIKVVIDGNKLTFYRGAKETHSFTISECSFHSLIQSSLEDSSCDLTIKTPEDNYGVTIDCSMLGKNRYLQLLDALGFNDQEPIDLTEDKE